MKKVVPIPILPPRCYRHHAPTPAKTLSLKTDCKTNNHSPHPDSMPMRETKSIESYDEKGFLKIDHKKKIAPIPLLPSNCSRPQAAEPMKILSLTTDYKTNNQSHLYDSMAMRKSKSFKS